MSKKKVLPSTNRTKKCRTSSPVAEIIASNVDLLTEILLRVPAKSLIKMKSVSKQWLSLISDSGFARNHTHQNPAPLPSGLYFYSDDRITRVSLHGHPRTTLPDFSFLDGSGPTVCHSSNGLMLCSSTGDYEKFVICNPTTQKFVVLPTLTSMSKSYIVFGSYLVFDPKQSPCYKVVVVGYSYDLNTSKFDVYSSESGSWKSTTIAPRIRHWGIKYGAVWDGAIIVMSCGEDRDHGPLCFRFNVDEEKLTSTRVPFSDTNCLKKILYFGECRGQLLLIQAPSYRATEFRVLEMMEDENNFWWTVKYVVDLKPLLLPGRRRRRDRRRCIFSVTSVMNVVPNGNDLAVVLKVLFDFPGADLRGEIIKYDIKCKTLKVLCNLPRADLLTSQPSYRFIESLTPV